MDFSLPKVTLGKVSITLEESFLQNILSHGSGNICLCCYKFLILLFLIFKLVTIKQRQVFSTKSNISHINLTADKYLQPDRFSKAGNNFYEHSSTFVCPFSAFLYYPNLYKLLTSLQKKINFDPFFPYKVLRLMGVPMCTRKSYIISKSENLISFYYINIIYIIKYTNKINRDGNNIDSRFQ